MDNKNPVICALDTKEIESAKNMVKKIIPYVGAVKLGLEFFTINGPEGIKEISKLGLPIFLDLKFHDIPNTVAQAVKSAVQLNVSILTIHTLGGVKMMKAAADAAKEEAARLNTEKPVIVGVTILTSMDEGDLQEIGVDASVKDQVKKLALNAKKAGLDGVVCSAHEIKMIKEICGKDFKTIVPGIRPAGVASNDQKRVMTPAEAMAEGADFLVIGRPITEASDPAGAAADIAAGF